MSLSRRKFLAGVGAGGTALIGLPFLEMLHSGKARAQTGAPLRFLMIHSGQGWNLSQWLTDWSNGALTSSRLGPHLRSLDRHKNDLIVLRGIQSHVNYHTGNMAGFSSGNPLISGGYGQSISIDQAIANEIGTTTRHKSLEFGVHSGCFCIPSDQPGRSSMVFPGPNQVLHPVSDPSVMFDKVFAGVEASEDDAARLFRYNRKSSVIDSALGQLASLRAQAGPDDRRRLDAHLTSVREIEQAIMNDSGSGASCTPPTDPEFNTWLQRYRDDFNTWFRQPEHTEKVLQHQIKIIGKAFQCDATRVASLMILDEGLPQTAVWLRDRVSGIDSDTIHGHKHNNNQYSKAYEAWVIEHLGLMLDELQAEDIDGNRIIDNTVVYFGSGLPMGAHSVADADWGFILAGGGASFFNAGQVVNFKNPSFPNYGEGERGREPTTDAVSINRLQLTMLRAFGLQSQTFGSVAHSAGGPVDQGLLA